MIHLRERLRTLVLKNTEHDSRHQRAALELVDTHLNRGYAAEIATIQCHECKRSIEGVKWIDPVSQGGPPLNAQLAQIVDTWGFMQFDTVADCAQCALSNSMLRIGSDLGDDGRSLTHIKCHKCLGEGYIGDIFQPKKGDKPLLIDTLYRQTFKKGSRNPVLRQRLTNARRIVLADEMAAFLYTLRLQIILGSSKRPLSRGRSYRRLDDCRFFARLPHKITWLEYEIAAMYQRELETKQSQDEQLSDAGRTIAEQWENLARVRSSGSRIGWLMYQHDKIETAFAAQYFIGVPERAAMQYPVEAIWCTDDTPLPWSRLITLDDQATSAYVTGVPGYDRSNVGMREVETHLRVESEGMNYDDFTVNGRAAMMWAFLSTFNKVPVFGEQEIVRARGFVAQGSYHKFLDHKILTINIPEKRTRRIVSKMLALIRRRAHLVRGHWRDDYRLAKGNKSLWISEHQRGDASLGFVTHDYNVEHERP